MSVEPRLLATLGAVAGVLQGMRVPWALGGAVAMAMHGYVRATRDLDLLVLVPQIRSQELADALKAAGFTMRDAGGHAVAVDVPRMQAATRELGHFRVWWHDVKVELFVPKVPLQDAILKRCERRPLAGIDVPLTTVEDLILLKMVFHRDKDLVDTRRLIAVSREGLDRAYLEGWIPRTLVPAVGEELRAMLADG